MNLGINMTPCHIKEKSKKVEKLSGLRSRGTLDQDIKEKSSLKSEMLKSYLV